MTPYRCHLRLFYRLVRDRIQGPTQISDEVLYVFNTHRVSDQSIAKPSAATCFRRHAGVSHGGWMLDQRFHST